ncbi:MULTISPECIES: hypothetical protein [Rhodomicrobium]|nr:MULTISPECIES: hypothetical protein [Rhodomicrobium]
MTGMAALTAVTWTGPAQALTMQECSTKYKAAQAAGTVAGKSWNEFRKAECGPATNAATAVEPAPAPKPKAAPKRAAVAPATTTGDAVFPNKVSPKYAGQPAGRARMHTCLEQYHANKTNNGNGNLKWTQKGGGYYSECNKRLAQQ